MTLEAIMEAIKNLIIKRANAHGNRAEQERINVKLTKLYELKRIYKEQEYGRINGKSNKTI